MALKAAHEYSKMKDHPQSTITPLHQHLNGILKANIKSSRVTIHSEKVTKRFFTGLQFKNLGSVSFWRSLDLGGPNAGRLSPSSHPPLHTNPKEPSWEKADWPCRCYALSEHIGCGGGGGISIVVPPLSLTCF